MVPLPRKINTVTRSSGNLTDCFLLAWWLRYMCSSLLSIHLVAGANLFQVKCSGVRLWVLWLFNHSVLWLPFSILITHRGTLFTHHPSCKYICADARATHEIEYIRHCSSTESTTFALLEQLKPMIFAIRCHHVSTVDSDCFESFQLTVLRTPTAECSQKLSIRLKNLNKKQ